MTKDKHYHMITIKRRLYNKMAFKAVSKVLKDKGVNIDLETNIKETKRCIAYASRKHYKSAYGFVSQYADAIMLTPVLKQSTSPQDQLIKTISHETLHLVVRDLFENLEMGCKVTEALDKKYRGKKSVLKRLAADGYLGGMTNEERDRQFYNSPEYLEAMRLRSEMKYDEAIRKLHEFMAL